MGNKNLRDNLRVENYTERKNDLIISNTTPDKDKDAINNEKRSKEYVAPFSIAYTFSFHTRLPLVIEKAFTYYFLSERVKKRNRGGILPTPINF